MAKFFGKSGRLTALGVMIRGMGPSAVAFSGGVDSSLVALLAFRADERAVAFTLDGPSLPRSELRNAGEIAERIGIRHVVLKAGRMPAGYYANRGDRCYHCRKESFSRICREAGKLGLKSVLDGCNADDFADHGHGMRAGAELGVVSPLAESGIGKAEVRGLAKMLGLPNYGKPAEACLASRVVGGRITRGALLRVEGAEAHLKGLGFRVVRVRSHGELARIQVGRGELARLLRGDVLARVSARLKKMGFKHVCVDAGGYARGG